MIITKDKWAILCGILPPSKMSSTQRRRVNELIKHLQNNLKQIHDPEHTETSNGIKI